jgi:hypothetical protein
MRKKEIAYAVKTICALTMLYYRVKFIFLLSNKLLLYKTLEQNHSSASLDNNRLYK